MFGRYSLNENPRKLAEYFNLSGDLDFSSSWNIAPLSRICSITAGVKKRYLQIMRWGLIPSWAKNAPATSRGKNFFSAGVITLGF